MKRPAILCGQAAQRGGNWPDQPDLSRHGGSLLRTDCAVEAAAIPQLRDRLKSENQNWKRLKTNQRQRIKRQENTNERSRYETSNT
jgi:hypothetical protein